MKVRSLRWQVILPPLIVILLGGILFGFLIPTKIIERQTDLRKEQITQSAYVFSRLVAAEWPETSFNFLAQSWAEETGAQVLILSQSGTIIGSSSPGQSSSLIIMQPEMQQAIDSGSGLAVTESKSQFPIAVSIVAAHEILVEDDRVGFVRVEVQLPELQELRTQIRLLIWVGFLLIALISAIPLTILTTYSGRRLASIADAAKQISTGNRTVSISPGIRDEIGIVATGINRLAGQIDKQFNILLEEQNKINAVLSQMNEGVIILDEQGKISLANHAALEIFDLKQTEVVGSPLIRVVFNHQVIDLWEQYQSDWEGQSSLLEIPDRNKIIHVSITSMIDSSTEFALMVIQDLTQLRMLQTIRRDFVSNISHELRTPIASLKALTETLQISAIDDPDAARKFLDRMEIEIEALAQMVAELLELTRIESGQVPLELQRIDANQVLRSSVERIAVQAERAGLSLLVDTSNLPVFILADPPRLEQVLVNIIHNATKFTPAGGQVRCTVEADPQFVTIKISDNGRGIPLEDQPRIFERFYKSRRPKQGSGTGLGLSIAKHLVEAHAGRIWVESRLGEGSTFFISLPRQG